MNIVEIKKISDKRLEVCTLCPNRKSYNLETKTWEKKVENDSCGLCGCPLVQKSMANVDAKEGEGGCPVNKW